MENLRSQVPQNILWTLTQIKNSGYEAFVVGGCVRDMFLGRNPHDWDITTNATPEQIIGIFEKTDRRVVYENDFGTVGIIDKDLDRDDVGYGVEVTPYRTEFGYSDSRRPDKVLFSDSIHQDVKRRDFTINAMAYDPLSDVLIDDFEGRADIEKRIIRTVGDPEERFGEDALRIMRMVRFSAQLGFIGETDTVAAVKKFAPNLSKISQERIRDEFIKIIDARYAKDGMEMMRVYGLLGQILPEFLEGVSCDQGGIHKFDVWTHLIKSLEHASNKGYPFHVKLAALFHDIGKPRSRRPANGRGTKEWTFYGHEVIGAKMTEHIMKRLKFSKDLIAKVVKLVRYHMFFSDPEAITLSAVRRMVANVGEDMIWELTDLRTCDRIGTGRPNEKPYRLRKYEAMIEEVLRDPISVAMLKINGDIMIKEMELTPGRKMGWVLHALLEEVLDSPEKNTRVYLEKRALELYDLPDAEIKNLGEAGKEKKEELDSREIMTLHKKYKV